MNILFPNSEIHTFRATIWMANQRVGISPNIWIKKQQERGVGDYRLFNNIFDNRIVDTKIY